MHRLLAKLQKRKTVGHKNTDKHEHILGEEPQYPILMSKMYLKISIQCFIQKYNVHFSQPHTEIFPK